VASATLWITHQLEPWAIVAQACALLVSLWRRSEPFAWQRSPVALNVGMLGIAAGTIAAERGAVLIVFTDPWLSPVVESARHVLISHADSASPFDSMLGAFALTELIAAKVVVALGDQGRTRVAQLETVHGRLRDGLATVVDPAGGVQAG